MTWHFLGALANTWRDLRNHASTSFFAAALIASPVALTPLAQTLPGPAGVATWLTLQVVGGLASGVWLPVALITATREYAIGSDPGVGGLLARTARGVRRLLSYLGTQVLLGLIAIGILIAASVPAIGTFVAALAGAEGRVERVFEGPLAPLLVVTIILALVLFLAGLVLIYLRYGVAGMVNVLERRSPAASLRRSRGLMRGHWLDLFVLWLIIGAVVSVLYLVLGGPALILSFASASTSPLGAAGPFGPAATSPAAALVIGISLFLLQVAAGPIATGALTNFYLALRGDEPYAQEATPAARAGTAGEDAAMFSPALSDLPQPPLGPHGQADAAEEQDAPGDDDRAGKFPEEERGDHS